MFERFTDRARRVVVLAQEEARFFNHNYIGTEHFLLGLLNVPDGVGCRALEKLGATRDLVRADLEQIIGAGHAPPSGHIPFTPRAKKVIELSLRESLQLGHSHIGTEHLLLGLIREGEGVACQMLAKRGIDFNELRKVIVGLMSSEPSGPIPTEALRSATVGIGFAGKVPSDDMPVCPGCRYSLKGHLASRILPIEGSPKRELYVAYCLHCGVAIETRIEEAGA